MEAIQSTKRKKCSMPKSSRLPQKYRPPLLLCYFEGLTQKEAAMRLGWTEGKVRALLSRGGNGCVFVLIRPRPDAVRGGTNLTGRFKSQCRRSETLWLLLQCRPRYMSYQEKLLPTAECP